MNRESWFWAAVVLLVILLLGSLSLLMGSDIDTSVTPTVPQQELPDMEDGVDINATPGTEIPADGRKV